MNKEYLIQNLKHWDWESYGKENKDLRYDSSSLLKHALNHGIKEGRTLKFDKNKNFLKQSENFDISTYLWYLNINTIICHACKNNDIFEKIQKNNFGVDIPINKLIEFYHITNMKDKINVFITMMFAVQQTQNKIGNNNLVISLYNETKISRAIELLYCLVQNLKNPYINIIHILLERESDTETPYFIWDCIDILIKYHKNIKISYISKRPRFNDLFDYCNNNINGIAMIANSDIVYDETLSKINIVDNDFIVLTRYNLYNNNKFEIIKIEDKKIKNKTNIYSQDTWIFQSPMKYVINAPVNLGSMFSDSVLSYLLKHDTKYNVYNKALYIKSFHIQTESSLSEVLSVEQRNKYWMEVYELLNKPTKNFVHGVTLETNSSKSEIVRYNLNKY